MLVPSYASRSPLATILFAAALASFIGCARQQPGTFVLGAVLPMTGDAGTFGQNAAHGIELAVRRANEQDLLKGKRIELRVEDSRGSATDAVAAARKLLDVTHVDALVGDVTSAGTQAMIPIITRSEVPLVSPSASDPELSGASPFFARVWPSDIYEARVIGPYALQQGYHRIVIVYANTDYGSAMAAQFANEVSQSNVDVSIPVDRETLDYRPLLQRIRLSRADAVFLILYPEDMRRMLQQLSEQGVRIPILATATAEDPMVASIPGATQIVFASPVPPSDSTQLRRNFVDSYRKTFGTDPGVLSDTGYDSAMLLILAAAATGGADPIAMSNWIKSQQDYPGVSGTMSFDGAGDVRKPYQLKTVRQGKFVQVSATAGS